MARKKKHPAHENHERWLISYADFITLLFAFFVVMFASSQTDKHKAQQVSDSVKEAMQNGATKALVHEILGGTVDNTGKGSAQMKGPGGSQKITTPRQEIPPDKVAVTELTPSMEFLSKSLAQEIKDHKVDVRLESRGLVISLRQAAFFPSGDAEVAGAGSATALKKIADVLKGMSNQVVLEGHTDSIPIHNDRFHNNMELSAARSVAVMNLLTDKFGVPAGRFHIAGYADTVPVDSNDTAEGRAHNRRVDVVIQSAAVVVKTDVNKESAPQENAKPAKPSPAPTTTAKK
ncbi:MAG TPA: flagellar motor protein MotB [Bryobacteraceae bacterium]|nr:flagellar motor protein MotB [Bryobacteraceae bacterium]